MTKATRKPTHLSLNVYSEFRAAHSLAGFEIPHVHLWKLALEFRATLPLKTDRLIDLVHLQDELTRITAPYCGTFLNESLPEFSPTSENMAVWVWHQFLNRNPDTPLASVTVTLCDLAGIAMGSATVRGEDQT